MEAAASYLAEKARAKADSESKIGLHYDILASLVFLAILHEAQLNFVGWFRFRDAWPERAKFLEKAKLLYGELVFDFHPGNRPFQTILQLKRIRDGIVHAKTTSPKTMTEIVDSEPDMWAGLYPDWHDFADIEFLGRCESDTEEWIKELKHSAGIQASDEMNWVSESLRSLSD